MSRCKTVDFFYALIPLSRWRDFLIRRHVEGCARCQAGLASRAESRPLFVPEGTASIGQALWTAIEPVLAEGATEGPKPVRRRPPRTMDRLHWAAAAALLLVLVTGYWIVKDYQPEAVSAAAAALDRFEIAYVRVDGKPANTMVFQPHASDMIIVWAGKNE